MDHIGACERILKTQLSLVYSVKIRRFVALFLITLPFALLHQMETDWLVPLVIMLVSYPLVSLDQIGIELQNPFYKSSLNHLPLDEIAEGIEKHSKKCSLLLTTKNSNNLGPGSFPRAFFKVFTLLR